MKSNIKVIALLVVAVMFGAISFATAKGSNFDYVDAKTLTIINKAQDDGLSFNRIDASKYDAPKGAKKYLSYSTGIAVVFRTDSRTIAAKWSNIHSSSGSNMTPIFTNGLDLYIRDGEEWVYAGVARPKAKKTDHQYIIVKSMPEGVKECMLYLPMFNRVTSLEIGVDNGALIEAMPSPFKHKIVFVGSSITHGASASRPGACYVAKMGRALNAETPNIGLSGMCKLDDYYADIVCDTKADAFVFDAFSNPTAEQIEAQLYNFVKRITKAHPNTPFVFLQTLKRDKGYFNLTVRKNNYKQRAVAEVEMAKVCKKFKNVYFVNPGIYVGEDNEGTVDGVHPNDLGIERTLSKALPKIKKILKKYNIK